MWYDKDIVCEKQKTEFCDERMKFCKELLRATCDEIRLTRMMKKGRKKIINGLFQ